jgi:hypothetical protein
MRCVPVLCVAALAAASPARAADGIGSGRAVLLGPVSFLNVDDIDFGLVVAPSSGNGTITINPGNAVVTYTNLVGMPSVATQRGRLVGSADPGQDVQVTTSLPTQLHRDGITTNPSVPVSLILNHFPTSGNDTFVYTANTSRTFVIYVGGTLTVPAGTGAGTYSNTFEVTATHL